MQAILFTCQQTQAETYRQFLCSVLHPAKDSQPKNTDRQPMKNNNGHITYNEICNLQDTMV